MSLFFQVPLQVFGHEKKVVHISAGYNHSSAITGMFLLFMPTVVIHPNKNRIEPQ